MTERIRSVFTAERLLFLSTWLFVFSSFAWPSTHVLILITKPPELASWTGHLLIAISWMAIMVTCLDYITTAEVRDQNED